MKVFFYSSPASVGYEKNCEDLYRFIETLGYVHLNKETIDKTFQKELKKLKDGEKQTSLYKEKLKEFIKSTQGADICIFEVSYQSLGIGYLIDKSLENGKPTIILYFENNIPHILSAVDNDQLIIRNYNHSNYKKVIKEAIEQAREKRDKRFNFFLSPKLLDYLEQASKKEGITKSKLIRDLIVNHMRTELKTDSLE